MSIISPLADMWLVPEGVIAEVEVHRPIHPYLSALASKSETSRNSVEEIHPFIASWDLGQGESEVLTLALYKPGAYVILDDLQARKCATLFDIPLAGSLGLLVMAKRKGLLNKVRPHIQAIVDLGLRIDSGTLENLYKALGE